MRRFTFLLLALLLIAASSTVAQSSGKVCPSRDEVQELLYSGVTAEQISEIYAGCVPDTTLPLAPEQFTTPTGSVFWEAIDSCGYHPQRRELECSIEVRQQFGFAGTPPGAPGFNGPGSWEWVIFCVNFGAGLVPVNTSAVHVHDEAYGFQPPWYYGVAVAADPQLHTAAVNGQSLQARAILSWTLIPNNCNYVPIWGNQADFFIKLDP